MALSITIGKPRLISSFNCSATRSRASSGRIGAASGPDGEADDDGAFVAPWGVELGAVSAPALLVQGGRDRVVPATHAGWMLERLPRGELWLRPREGHVSVLTALGVALDWASASL